MTGYIGLVVAASEIWDPYLDMQAGLYRYTWDIAMVNDLIWWDITPRTKYKHVSSNIPLKNYMQ